MEAKSTLSKLENGRAEFAFNCVKEVVKNRAVQKDYRSYARKIPSMILTHGIAQTLAFMYAKRKEGNAYDLLLSHITNYLQKNKITYSGNFFHEQDLLEWVISLDIAQYRYVTEEVLSFLKWIKRFSEGMIDEQE